MVCAAACCMGNDPVGGSSTVRVAIVVRSMTDGKEPPPAEDSGAEEVASPTGPDAGGEPTGWGIGPGDGGAAATGVEDPRGAADGAALGTRGPALEKMMGRSRFSSSESSYSDVTTSTCTLGALGSSAGGATGCLVVILDGLSCS